MSEPSRDDLLDQVPEALRRELLLIDPVTAFQLAQQFLNSDEGDQAGMTAFIESDGPRRVRDLQTKHRDGTPTSAELEEWLP